MRAKALEVLPALPPAKLAGVLADGKVLERLVSGRRACVLLGMCAWCGVCLGGGWGVLLALPLVGGRG